MRAAALGLSGLLLLLYAALYAGASAFLPEGAWPGLLPEAPWEFLLLAGLLALPVGALTAVKEARLGGAVQMVGAALAGLAFTWHAGPHLNRYLPGLFLAVLPQALAGALFLLHARKTPRSPAKAKPRRR